MTRKTPSGQPDLDADIHSHGRGAPSESAARPEETASAAGAAAACDAEGAAAGGQSSRAWVSGLGAYKPGPLPILVVDDVETNRELLIMGLEAYGFKTEAVDGGRRALERIAETRYALVLLDLMMPDMSGIDVLSEIRRRYPVADLPVIMTTAMNDSASVVEALHAGANDYVTKPLDFAVVVGRMRTQLQLKDSKERLQALADELELRNRFIRETFGRYLTSEVVSSLLETPDGLKLGGEARQVTVVLSDLRGFTPISERLKPEQVVTLLNHYLGTMTDVIVAHKGTIDEFIGDSILAIFGAPVQRPDDAERALACAVAMQEAMASVNEFNARMGLPELEMGIAVHSGEAVVGNIGSQTRAKYGIVGSLVNATARIESNTVGGQVLVSETALAAAGPVAVLGEKFAVRAKGFEQPLVVYELRGLRGHDAGKLSDTLDPAVPLTRPLSLQFRVIKDKVVGDDAHTGKLWALTPHGGVIESDFLVSPLDNIVMELDGSQGLTAWIYAKILRRPVEGGFLLRFTSLPPEAATYLKRLRESEVCA